MAPSNQLIKPQFNHANKAAIENITKILGTCRSKAEPYTDTQFPAALNSIAYHQAEFPQTEYFT